MKSFQVIPFRFVQKCLAVSLVSGLAFAAVVIAGADAVRAEEGQTATLFVITNTVNNYGGTKGAGDFTISVSGASATPCTFSGTPDAFAVTVNADEIFEVSQQEVPGYTTSFSPECSGKLFAGDQTTCVVTNSDVYEATTGTLMLFTDVVNDHGGAKTPGDFLLTVTRDGPPQTSAGSAAGTAVAIAAGGYDVVATSDVNYTSLADEGCVGSLAIGETRTCRVVFDDKPPFGATTGTLVVVTSVTNSYGGTKTPSDFTLSMTGTDVSPSMFTGLSEGTVVILGPGVYTVNAAEDANYTKSLSSGCSGTMAVGQRVLCTVSYIEYRQVPSGGSGSGGGGGVSGGWGTGVSSAVAVPLVSDSPPGQEQPSVVMVPGLSIEQYAVSGAPQVLGIETDIPSVETVVVEGTSEPTVSDATRQIRKNREIDSYTSNSAVSDVKGLSEGSLIAVQPATQPTSALQATKKISPKTPSPKVQAGRVVDREKPFDIPFGLISFAALVVLSGLCFVGFKELNYVPRKR